MAVDVYYTSVTPSRKIKQQQREVTRILESRRVPYSLIDVAVDERLLEEMRSRAGNPSALPPQMFNDGDYLGDYLRLYEAVEDEAFEIFLKFSPSAKDKPLIRVDFSRCRADDNTTPVAEEALGDSTVEVKAMISRYERKEDEKGKEERERLEEAVTVGEEEGEEDDDDKEEQEKNLEEDVDERTTPIKIGAAVEEIECPLVTTQSPSERPDTAAVTREMTAKNPEAETGSEQTTESQLLPEIKPAESLTECEVSVTPPKSISIPDAFKHHAEMVMTAPVTTTSRDEQSDALLPDGSDGKQSDVQKATELIIGAKPVDTAATQPASATLTAATARTSELPRILQAVLVPVPSQVTNPEDRRTPSVEEVAARPPARRQAPPVPVRQKKRPEVGRLGKGRAPPPPTAGGDRRKEAADEAGSEPGKLVQVLIRDSQAVVRSSTLEPIAQPPIVTERPEENEDGANAGKGKKSKKKGRGMCSQQ